MNKHVCYKSSGSFKGCYEDGDHEICTCNCHLTPDIKERPMKILNFTYGKEYLKYDSNGVLERSNYYYYKGFRNLIRIILVWIKSIQYWSIIRYFKRFCEKKH